MAPTTTEETVPIGPPVGLSSIPARYIPEQSLRRQLRSIGYDEAREDNYRLKGVQLIDNVREALQLPYRTFVTAATYYHKFRIRFPSSEYNYEDVALASLFTACKVEDTIKKSKDILCAAHNLRHPNDNKTPDDKTFESSSRFTVGLERHILETIGFDFRGQYPQKLLIKMIRKMFPGDDEESKVIKKTFLRNAYDMSIDLYKTFAPIKHSTDALVLAILALTAHLMDKATDKAEAIQRRAPLASQGCVYEVMLDLMDLYTQFRKSTKVGSRFDINRLMDVKIEINKKVADGKLNRYHEWCDRCEKESPDVNPATPGTSPAANSVSAGSSSVKRKHTPNDSTLRFVFDAEAARKERDYVDTFFNDEYEEYEVEVEEPVPDNRPRQPANPGRSGYAHAHRGSHKDHGWSPYSRGGRGMPDRHKGRNNYY
ncbi:cyclin-like protein [Echria macrotheca]|uniref:RNA polymerase II holoenzyme cyclin-like subunit n=1 Tax=Echria macrotheca TaxID=438768 RepID=A0AAJ0F9N1_9PEZI|nr:cyclin-like protein [Echria macrotheca]